MEPVFNLPTNRKKFSISLQGETTPTLYKGDFEIICMPTLRQKSNAAIMLAQLNNDLVTLDEATRLYHHMISEITARLLAAPQWWIASGNGQDLQDMNVIVEVYKNCAEAEREWRTSVWGKKEDETPEVRDTSTEDNK